MHISSLSEPISYSTVHVSSYPMCHNMPYIGVYDTHKHSSYTTYATNILMQNISSHEYSKQLHKHTYNNMM